MTTVAQQPGIDQTDTRPTIVEAMNAVMREIKGVSKRGRNTQQNYDFRGIDAVLNAAGPAFRDHGIVPTPILEHVEYRDVKTVTGKAAREVTVRVRYQFRGPRNDYLEAVVPGESMSSGDTGTAKAMSVAYRIALIQVLALPTTETDPDARSYERGTGSVNVELSTEAREAEKPSREELLEQVNTAASKVQELRGESDYAALDRLAQYCANRLGVNVIVKQSDEGAVEDIDLTRLKDAQLALLLGVIKRSIRELQSADQEA